jgi:hypothetical protein
VNVLFWLSIGLWVVALVSYALILSGNEQLQRTSARPSVFIPFEVLFRGTRYSRSLKYLYRILTLSAIGAVVTGGLFLLSGAA